MRRSGQDCLSARIAGVVIRTSPVLSSRTQRTLRAVGQATTSALRRERSTRPSRAPRGLLGVDDELSRLLEARHDSVRRSQLRALPERLAAIVDEHGPTTCPRSCFNVVEDVADHPGSRELDAVAARGAQNKARRGLTTIAGAPPLGR